MQILHHACLVCLCYSFQKVIDQDSDQLGRCLNPSDDLISISAEIYRDSEWGMIAPGELLPAKYPPEARISLRPYLCEQPVKCLATRVLRLSEIYVLDEHHT